MSFWERFRKRREENIEIPPPEKEDLSELRRLKESISSERTESPLLGPGFELKRREETPLLSSFRPEKPLRETEPSENKSLAEKIDLILAKIELINERLKVIEEKLERKL